LMGCTMLSSVLIVIGGLSVGFLFRNWSLPEVADRTTPFFRAGCHPSRHPSEEKVAHNGPLLRRVTDPFSKRPVVDNFQERRRDRSIPEHSQNISRELGNRPQILRKRPKKRKPAPTPNKSSQPSIDSLEIKTSPSATPRETAVDTVGQTRSSWKPVTSAADSGRAM
jgi:hypothetical protein